MTRASGKLGTAFSREWDMSIGMEQETLAATYLSVKGNQKAPVLPLMTRIGNILSEMRNSGS